MDHLAALFRNLFSQPGALLALLAMGSVSVRAEGLPADTRLRELHLERSNHSARPLPANVSFADVIGNEIEVFDNDNDTHQEGTHAFFIQLGDKTALALGYEDQFGGKAPREIRFKGQLVKLGPLLRSPPNASHRLMWVWEAELPPGAVPLVREKLPLPLIMYQDEMTILTAEGPKQAVLTSMHPARSILPGQAIGQNARIKLDEASSYKAIRVGDPVIQTSTGVVIAAVSSKEPWIPSMKEQADIDIVWLSFPRPPEPLSTPLTEVWGASVPSHPSVDEAFVQKLMPARALGTRIGETIEEAWERNPLLHRLPPEAKDHHFSEDYFGEEWVFKDQKTAVKDGRVVRIDYETACSIGTKTTMAYVNWLAEKFQQPKEVRKTPRGNALMAIWNQGPVWLAAMFNLSDKTISLDMFVAVSEAELKDRFNEDAFSVPATADKATFLSLATALASQAQPEDFGIMEKLPLSNPMTMASSGQTVMKKNGQDIPVEAPAKPATAHKAEETPAAEPPAGPAPFVNKAELRALAVQRIETLGRVVQAYNAMPEKLRQEARVQSVAGAFGLLRTHADRYPDLALNDDLRDTMEWALVFLDTGKLHGSPALQKLAQVTNAEIAIANAQRTAEHLATTFQDAKAAGTRAFDQVKTLDEIIQLLHAGVKGTGTSKSKVFTSKNTPELATEARQHLKFEAKNKTLRYIPKSVKIEGFPVPLEGIEELALLIKQTPEAPPASPVAGGTSEKPDDEVKQAALALCWVFNTAMASGMTELDDVKTVDDIIQRFKKGVQSGSQTHFLKSTLELAQAARPYVQLDLKKKLLLLSPAGLNAIPDGPMARQASPSLNYPGSPAEAERIAFNLATAFGLAKSTGSKELDNVKTVDAIIQRLHIGVKAGGDFAKTRFYVRTTSSQAAAAKPFLKFDPGNQSLFYQPGSMDANFHFPKPPPRPEAQTPSLASEHSEAEAQRTAQWLVSVFNAAVATGSQDAESFQTLDQVIRCLTTNGMIGAGVFKGRRFYARTKPGEAEAARSYLRFDSYLKTLEYSAEAITGSRSRSAAPPSREVGQRTASLKSTSANADETARSNAKIFCSIYNLAVSCGAEELQVVTTLDQALRRIMTGVKGGGPYRATDFSVEGTPEKAAAAKPYLMYEPYTKTLQYVAHPVGGSSGGQSRGSSTTSTLPSTSPRSMTIGRDSQGRLTYAGRTFANGAELEKALKEAREAGIQARDARNAQTIVSTYNAAKSSGAQALKDVNTVDQAIRRLTSGVNSGGTYKGRVFSFSAAPDEIYAAKQYIVFDSRQGTLVYKSPYR